MPSLAYPIGNFACAGQMTHDSFETFLFVVKVWLEGRELPGARPLWRGSARNVETGDTRYFSTAGELAQYIASTTGSMHPDD